MGLFGNKNSQIKTRVSIENMSCSHCAARVESAFSSVGLKADVNLDGKYALVTSKSPLDETKIRTMISDLGFEVTDIKQL